jgi:hypothetical protein
MASMLDREIDGEYHKEYEQGEEGQSQAMEKLDDADDPPENSHVMLTYLPPTSCETGQLGGSRRPKGQQYS